MIVPRLSMTSELGSIPEALAVIRRVHEGRVKANLQKLMISSRLGSASAGLATVFRGRKMRESWMNLQDSLNTLSEFLKENEHELQPEKGRAGP